MMAKLTTAGRNRIPAKNFALPGRRYPVNDPADARNALARVSQFGSSEEKAEVRRKVHAKYPGIGQSSGGYAPNPYKQKHGAGHYMSTMQRISDAEQSAGGYRPYEGSPADIRADKREAAKRGLPLKQWEGSAADRRMDAAKGGYVPNRAQNAAIRANSAHPRMHALSLASATHLKNQGHITPEHHARIERHVNSAMMQMKQPQMPAQQPKAAPFGSFAPPSTAQYA